MTNKTSLAGAINKKLIEISGFFLIVALIITYFMTEGVKNNTYYGNNIDIYLISSPVSKIDATIMKSANNVFST